MSEQTTEAPAPVQSAGPETAPAPAPTPATSEAPKADQQAASEGDRPAWLPSKFKDPEQLAKAYAELEKRLGQAPKQDAPKADPGVADRTAPTAEETLAVRTAGLDPEAIAEEFLSNGRVSDETYAKAEKIGLDRKFVDNYVQGQAALIQRQQAELYSEVGGPDEFQRVAAWARANLSPREIQAIDQATQNQSIDLAKIALRGLYARYQAAVGRDPNLVSGEAPGGNNGFRSQAEVTAAMRDPRYSRDPAYRADIEAKLRATGGVFQVRAG